jgi:hypothetical protein
MKRVTVLLVAGVLALAGCSSGTPAGAGEQPTSSATSGGTGPAGPTTSTTPTPTGDPIEFSVDGAGPYQLDAKLTDLQSAGKVTNITVGATGCPDTTTASTTGVWSGIQLYFHKDGTLYLLVNQSTGIPTPSGAYLGTKLADLKHIYAAVTGTDLAHGDQKAFLVTTLSGRAILFQLSSIQTVVSMSAGDSSALQQAFVNGTPYC